MSLLAALMLAQAAAPAAEDVIVVMAQRIRSIELRASLDANGDWACNLSASSGSTRVDELLCRAATNCARRNRDDREDFDRCIEQRRPGIIEDFRRSLRRSSNR